MKKIVFASALSLFVGVSSVAAHETEGPGRESPSVGPGKGIAAVDEIRGFRLSPQALRNFGVGTRVLKGKGPWKIPREALLRSGEEVNLYRVRDGFIKRVEFVKEGAASGELAIGSEELRDGDEVVLTGIGFLRIAEIAAFGGIEDGHSH